VEQLISRLTPVAHLIETVPSVYRHPVDPKDSHYVDLAVAVGASLIVSRDEHLLHLMDPSKSTARDFRVHFPHLEVLSPEQLLQRIQPDLPEG